MEISINKIYCVNSDTPFGNMCDNKFVFDYEVHTYPIEYDEQHDRFITPHKDRFIQIYQKDNLLYFLVTQHHKDHNTVSTIKISPTDEIPYKVQLWINTLSHFLKSYPAYSFIDQYVKEVKSYDIIFFHERMGEYDVNQVEVKGFTDIEWSFGNDDIYLDGDFDSLIGELTLWDHTLDIEEVDQDVTFEVSFSAIREFDRDSMIWQWLDKLYETSKHQKRFKSYVRFYQELTFLHNLYSGLTDGSTPS